MFYCYIVIYLPSSLSVMRMFEKIISVTLTQVCITCNIFCLRIFSLRKVKRQQDSISPRDNWWTCRVQYKLTCNVSVHHGVTKMIVLIPDHRDLKWYFTIRMKKMEILNIQAVCSNQVFARLESRLHFSIFFILIWKWRLACQISI